MGTFFYHLRVELFYISNHISQGLEERTVNLNTSPTVAVEEIIVIAGTVSLES